MIFFVRENTGAPTQKPQIRIILIPKISSFIYIYIFPIYKKKTNKTDP